MTDLILETFRFNGALLKAGNRITKPAGLTSARWQVMGAVELEGRPLTVAQIARRMGLTRQGVQRIVNDLGKLDMIVMQPNPDHKRSPLISLSDRGRQVMAEIDKAQIMWVNKLAEGLNESRIEQTLEILQDIRERLEHCE